MYIHLCLLHTLLHHSRPLWSHLYTLSLLLCTPPTLNDRHCTSRTSLPMEALTIPQRLRHITLALPLLLLALYTIIHNLSRKTYSLASLSGFTLHSLVLSQYLIARRLQATCTHRPSGLINNPFQDSKVLVRGLAAFLQTDGWTEIRSR